MDGYRIILMDMQDREEDTPLLLIGGVVGGPDCIESHLCYSPLIDNVLPTRILVNIPAGISYPLDCLSEGMYAEAELERLWVITETEEWGNTILRPVRGGEELRIATATLQEALGYAEYDQLFGDSFHLVLEEIAGGWRIREGKDTGNPFPEDDHA